jgi:hypothetical protein
VAFAQNDGRVGQIRGINLVHKLPASTTRRKRHTLSPNRNDFGDAGFAGGYHRRNRAVFCTKAYSAANVNANAKVQIASRTEQSTSDISGRVVIRQFSGSQDRFCLLDHLQIGEFLQSVAPYRDA